MGPPKLTIGKLKGKAYDYLSLGDTIYITGRLFLEEDMVHDEDGISNEADFIDLYEEPATVARMNITNKNDRLNVRFGENITNNPKWKAHIGSDWVDLGALDDDDNLVVTIPNKSINESDELDWIENTLPSLIDEIDFALEGSKLHVRLHPNPTINTIDIINQYREVVYRVGYNSSTSRRPIRTIGEFYQAVKDGFGSTFNSRLSIYPDAMDDLKTLLENYIKKMFK